MDPPRVVRLAKTAVRLVCPLAEGATSCVWLVQDVAAAPVAAFAGPQSAGANPATINRPNPQYPTMVLKILVCFDDASMRAAEAEINLHQQLAQAPNIVRLLDAAVRRPGAGTGADAAAEAFLLLEHCPGGSLADEQARRTGAGPMRERDVLETLDGVARAVAALHTLQPPVVHRDIKLENVLRAADGSVRLCDFGSATTRLVPVGQLPSASPEGVHQWQADAERHTTADYRAPELVDPFRRGGLTEKTDVWALGVLAYKLCFGVAPFASPLAALGGSFVVPPGHPYSSSILDLLAGTLAVDPSRRLNAPGVAAIIARALGRPGPPNPYGDAYRTPSCSAGPGTAICGLEATARGDWAVNAAPKPVALDAVAPGALVKSYYPETGDAAVVTPMRRGRPPRPTPSTSSASISSGDLSQSISAPAPARPAQDPAATFDPFAPVAPSLTASALTASTLTASAGAGGDPWVVCVPPRQPLDSRVALGLFSSSRSSSTPTSLVGSPVRADPFAPVPGGAAPSLLLTNATSRRTVDPFAPVASNPAWPSNPPDPLGPGAPSVTRRIVIETTVVCTSSVPAAAAAAWAGPQGAVSARAPPLVPVPVPSLAGLTDPVPIPVLRPAAPPAAAPMVSTASPLASLASLDPLAQSRAFGH